MKKMRKIVAMMLVLSMVCGICIFYNTKGNKYELTNHSLYMGSEENEFSAQVDELDEEEYFVIDDEVLENALVEYSKDINKVSYIDSLDEMYGNPINDDKFSDIAKIQIASYLGNEITDFSNVDSVTLDSKILLYDANDFNTYVGYNYTSSDNISGYITIATHTKAPLIKEINEGISLPVDSDRVYYLSEGEFYMKDGKEYKTLEDIVISQEDFEKLKEERIDNYYSFTTDLLASIELDTITMVNNITYLVNGVDNVEDLALGKTYDGQDGSGYGGITNPSKYLKDRYGGTISQSSSKSLSMQTFICNDFNEDNNCTLVAITRILYYYYNQGYKKLPSDYNTIYKKVLKVAKEYGYTEKKGTWPTKINNIIDDVLDDYGYTKSYSKGIYVWTFSGQVKKEIDNNRPVVMNIVRGYYGNHSISVSGYGIYKSKHKLLFGSYSKTHNMICVYDGWSRSKRYIDYEAFAYDLVSSGFGSFNTIIMK